MGIGKRLKEARELAGLTQEELGQLVGVTGSAITNYERETSHPKEKILYALINALKIEPNYLFQDCVSTLRRPAPALSADALQVARDYASLDNYGQSAVKAIITEERRRVDDMAEEEAPATKTIPLFGNSFAAGRGEPDFGNMWTDYEVPADSAAEFAIPINGDSMEPYLHDGSIAFGIKRDPADGEVAALLVDGEYRVKQICRDSFRNLHLFSLNRARRDADETIWADSGRAVQCFGVILMEKIPPATRLTGGKL